jgi:hypothetical protein
VASLYILVRSWRQRATTERCPLPLLLICFALAFDVTIALGRSGNGSSSPLPNRYVMPNLILLLAVAMYAWAHLPPLLHRREKWHWRDVARLTATAALVALVVTQVVDATGFGLDNGRNSHSYMESSSQFFVNLDRIPSAELHCAVLVELYFQPGAYQHGWSSFALKIHDAATDHLGEFQTGPFRAARRLGPLAPFGLCTRSTRS